MTFGSSPSASAPAAKPWWHSRTLWFNLIIAVLAAAEAGLDLLKAMLPFNAFALLAFVLALGNAGLRVITVAALTTSTPAPPPQAEPAWPAPP